MDKQISIKHTATVIDGSADTSGSVRAFNSSPGMIALQIRAFGSVTGKPSGKNRPSFSTANMSLLQVRELIAVLETCIGTIG